MLACNSPQKRQWVFQNDLFLQFRTQNCHGHTLKQMQNFHFTEAGCGRGDVKNATQGKKKKKKNATQAQRLGPAGSFSLKKRKEGHGAFNLLVPILKVFFFANFVPKCEGHTTWGLKLSPTEV